MKDREILFISGKMDKGGGERVVSILANHFAKTNHVRIITLLSHSQEYELDKSIEVIHLSDKDNHRILKLPYWVFKLAGIFRKMRGRRVVVVSFIARVNIVAMAANLFSGLPMVISERNDPLSDGRNILTGMAADLLYPKAERIVFQSNYAMNLFGRRIREKGVVIPNPIGPFEIQRPKEVEKAFVNVGRLAAQKNQTLLIKAFAEVSLIHPDYKLYIYGEGPLRKHLESLVNELGLKGRVMMPGIVNDIHERMLGCEVFVLSSDYEGQSNALLEAMALGMPCIATNLPGHDGIVDKNNVYLVEIGNQEQMKDAM
nr:glycosyltransferase [Clostridia bacterium]